MSYIYPHIDSKIIKLGIKWALYREKKPVDILPAKKEIESIKRWQQSRIVYIKEPEFKVGDVVYYEGNKKSKGIIYKEWIETWRKLNFKGYSHYYEGQQVESFKYVREVEHEVDWLNKMSPRYKKEYSEWQEVEQPEKWEIVCAEVDDGASINPKYTQFQEDKKSGVILAEI